MTTEDKVDVLWAGLWIFIVFWYAFFAYWFFKEWLQ